jgi:hypothetical protein
MSFPASPINGQIATVNNIAYVYSTANGTWTRTAGAAVTVGNGTVNSTSTTTGALIVSGGAGVSGNLNVGGSLTVSGTVGFLGNVTITGTVSSTVLPVVLNDISNQFNAKKAVFALKNNQTIITSIVDSKDLTVVIDGRPLSAYIAELRYPWITPYDGYRGFRVVRTSGNLKASSTGVAQYLVVYNAPDIGQQATVTQINTSATKQTRRYPYSASSIALGD